MIPIRNLAAFQAAVARGAAILITDNGRRDGRPVVHQAPTPHLRDSYFFEKVVANGGRNGRYFELRNAHVIPPGSRRCPNC